LYSYCLLLYHICLVNKDTQYIISYSPTECTHPRKQYISQLLQLQNVDELTVDKPCSPIHNR